MHWKRNPVKPHTHDETVWRKPREEDGYYEKERRVENDDAKQDSEDVLRLAERDQYKTAYEGDYETADEGHWETADEDDYETADEGDYDWERYNTEIDEAVLNQHCGIEENSNMQNLANEQQWQETEKSIGGEQKYGVGCENSTDVTLESKQTRGEMEQTIVGNEDVMSGLKYRFVLPEKVESQPLTDARKREWERSTDCLEKLDEEKAMSMMREDDELGMCEDEAQMQFDVEEKLEETDVHSSFEVKEYNRMEDFLANNPEKEMMRLTGDKKTVFMMSPERENTYYVKGRFDRSEHMLLLDTGCSHSVMPWSLYTALTEDSQLGWTESTTTGCLADGSSITIQGVASVTFRIGNTTFIHEFQIADIDGKILLGMDFFRRHRCTIDVHRYSITIGEQTLQCCDANGFPLVINVQSKRSVIVPPQSEKHIEGWLTRFRRGSTEGIVEPRHSIIGLMIATSLHKPDGPDICLRVLNATDEEIMINEGTLIGQYIPVDEVETSLPSSSQPVFRRLDVVSEADFPSHLSTHLEEWSQDLGVDEKDLLKKLLINNQDIFSRHNFDVGKTTLTKHEIPVEKDTKPIKLNPYRQSPEQEKEIERQLKQMIEAGLVEQGRGAWSFPVVLARKKNGDWRFCIDYRKLNHVTCKDAYPIPRIDESLDALGGSKWFTTLDLVSGYWQLPLSEDAKEKSAFVTRSGLWQWMVLPFGLTWAPGNFERLMETVFHGLQWETLLIYLDDVIIFSQDVETHLKRLD